MASKYCVGDFLTSPGNADQCVHRCPTRAGYEQWSENSQVVCRYKQKPDTVKFPLQPVNAVNIFKPGGTTPYTLEELSTVAPALYATYVAEEERYNSAFQESYTSLSKDEKVADAFRRLMSAESARADDPQGYQNARTAYYSLIKGEAWTRDEMERIESAEVLPTIAEYHRRAADAAARRDETGRALEAVTAVKDNVITMRDMFEAQVEKLKDAVLIEKKRRVSEVNEQWQWMDGLLNIILFVCLGLAAVVVAYKMYSRATATRTYSSPYSRFR